MHTLIKGDSANQIYRRLSLALMNNPDYVNDARGLQTMELINCSLVLSNPRDRLVTLAERGIDLRYLAGELCFYLSCSTKLEDIAKYSSFWSGISDDGVNVNSAYGYRIFDERHDMGYTQFDYALENLKTDKATRKAVIFVSGPTDAIESKDNVCTMTLQFLIRANKLNLITTMRSNDIRYGLTYDMPFFTIVQEIMMMKLKDTYPDLELGFYMHNAGSMHVYHTYYDQLNKIKNSYKVDESIPLMPELIDHDIAYWFNEMLTYERTGKKGLATEFQQTIIRWLGKEKK